MLNVFLILCYNINQFGFLIVLIPLIWVIGGNALFIYLFKKRAINKYVKPILKSKKLILIDSKWAGFFDTGDFKKDNRGISLVFTNGSPFISLYVYVYYQDENLPKRITIRIDTVFIFIRNVAFSNEL